jgi:hypothetical protein
MWWPLLLVLAIVAGLALLHWRSTRIPPGSGGHAEM